MKHTVCICLTVLVVRIVTCLHEEAMFVARLRIQAAAEMLEQERKRDAAPHVFVYPGDPDKPF